MVDGSASEALQTCVQYRRHQWLMGALLKALQTYEQYMEMYTPSMYSTGDVHLTVHCT